MNKGIIMFVSSTEYDNQFNEHNILYYPWVGRDYKNSKQKILVVGESHYYGKECENNESEKEKIDTNRFFTRECCKEQFNVFKNAQAILANNLIDNNFIADKIAFYNFFCKCIGFTPSDKQFSKNYLEESRKLFFKIVEILNPNIAIVWGTSKIWEWMPLNACEINGYTYYYDQYPDTKIIHIRHPSRNTELCRTAQELKEFFERNGISYPLQKN